MKRWFHVAALTLICASCAPGPDVHSSLVDVQQWVRTYYLRNGSWPKDAEALLTEEVQGRRLDDPVAPMDPWSRIYVIQTDQTCTLITLGRDGRPGGRGADADHRVSAVGERCSCGARLPLPGR